MPKWNTVFYVSQFQKCLKQLLEKGIRFLLPCYFYRRLFGYNRLKVYTYIDADESFEWLFWGVRDINDWIWMRPISVDSQLKFSHSFSIEHVPYLRWSIDMQFEIWFRVPITNLRPEDICLLLETFNEWRNVVSAKPKKLFYEIFMLKPWRFWIPRHMPLPPAFGMCRISYVFAKDDKASVFWLSHTYVY
jgi:hypothetical protein